MGPREIASGGEWIYGRNPVEEALAAGRRECVEVVLPSFASGEDDQISRIREEALSRRIVVRTMQREQLDRLTRFGHHQGVALKTRGYPYSTMREIMADVADDPNAIVVVLDHLEDPQNTGAIIRTACAAGAKGVVIPEDRSCGITPAVVRASAGGTEHIKIARVVNIARAIEDMQKDEVWFTGLDWGEDAKNYTDIDFSGRVGIVVGSEGSGISRLVRKTCDFIAVLPMPGGFESLNASVAAGIALYEVLRQHSSRQVK